MLSIITNMAKYAEAIEILKKDLKKKGLEKVAQDMNLHLHDDSIKVEMLNKDYIIKEEGVFQQDKEAGELETMLILNAALSPGIDCASADWKSYENFSGTGGHVGYLKEFGEGTLAKLSSQIVKHKDEIIKKYDTLAQENVSGSDLSFVIEPFPGIRIFCQIYSKDDEFPAEAKIFFSANADKIMPAMCFEQLAMMWIKEIKKIVTE